MHRCPKCSAVFERVSGCPTMKCLVCKHEWCWICGSKMNTCHTITILICVAINVVIYTEPLQWLKRLPSVLSAIILFPIVTILAILLTYVLGFLLAFFGIYWIKKKIREKLNLQKKCCIDGFFRCTMMTINILLSLISSIIIGSIAIVPTLIITIFKLI